MRKLRNVLSLLAFILIAGFSNAQTCSSPINVTADGNFIGQDSTNTTRYFKFTATYENMRIKLWIKNYTSSGNYQVKLYNNNCSDLPGNDITPTPDVNGDTVTLIRTGLTASTDYLIELSKISPSGPYLVYDFWVDRFAYNGPASINCHSVCGVPSTTCELVCNGSFECLLSLSPPNPPISGPGLLNSIVYGWFSATGSTPDVFGPSSVSSSTNVQVPCNYWGYQSAYTGGNYAGIYWDGPGGYNGTNTLVVPYTEYLETRLTNPMQAGKQYVVSFYVNRPDGPEINISSLAVYITTAAINYASSGVTTTITNVPTTTFTNTALFSNKSSWTRLSFCYTASGNEQYLTIGRPGNSSTVSTTPSSSLPSGCNPANTFSTVPWSQGGYLYIDEVSVKLMSVDLGSDLNVCYGFSTPLTPSISCNGTPNTNLTYSWSPSTYLSSTNTFTTSTAPTNTITYTFSLIATGENSVACTATDNVVISPYSSTVTPPSPTITASQATACIGSVVSFTASGGSVGNYTWFPGGATGTTCSFTLSAPVTITLVTGTTCTSQATFTWSGFSDYPCGCVDGCQTTIAGGSIGSQNTNSVYCISADVTISGAATFTNSDFRFYPNIKVTVPNSSTLTILGCHLYGCSDMWQGIVVEPGGVLKIGTSGTGLTSMVEDALVAIDVKSYTLASGATSILTATNVIFNRNTVGIKLNDYTFNQATYPYTISNNLFTSRTITFSTLSWPNTSTVKNSTTSPSSALQTPYLDNTLYPPVAMKAPYSTDYPTSGMELYSVGYTSVSTLPVFKGIQIGTTGSTSYNVFDNLKTCLTASNSNVTIVNSIFQNGVRYGRGSSSGGKGIVATSTQPAYSVGPAVNNQIKVIPGSGTSFVNKFYELTTAADVTGYLHSEFTYNEVYSYVNDYSLYSNVNPLGGTGIKNSTNRYHTLIANNNKLFNIRNAITLDVTTGDVIVGTRVGYGRYIGSATFNNNLISKHPGTPAAGEYVNVGISVNDAYAAATNSYAAVGGSAFNIQTNTMTVVHNGIGVSNVAFTPVSITSNTVNMANEPNSINPLPAQNGIYAAQVTTVAIHSNSVTGVATYTTDMRAIKTSMNSVLTVKCNFTSTLARGLDFNGSQTSVAVEDNIMQVQNYGFCISNNGSIGTQGNSTYPTNNQWLSSWTGTNTMTYTENNNSSAQNSKIYVQWGSSSLDPNLSGTTNGTYGQDDYFYTVASNTLNTILNVGSNTITLGCRLGGSGGGRLSGLSSSSNLEHMENLVQDKIPYKDKIAETRFIDKNRIFRLLKSDESYKQNSAILDAFYNNNTSSVMETFFDIEMDLLNGDKSNAQSKIQALNSSGIEGNYKIFYSILVNKGDSLNTSDSLSLITLANSCPYIEGGVVYQARALYNQLFNVYLNYEDNCPKLNSSRLINEYKYTKITFTSKIYPNPNNGEFIVELDKVLKDQLIEILILDVSGKVVFSKSSNESLIRLKIDLKDGVYLMKVKMQDGTNAMHKLVITK